jgi:hypothetical protein
MGAYGAPWLLVVLLNLRVGQQKLILKIVSSKSFFLCSNIIIFKALNCNKW